MFSNKAIRTAGVVGRRQSQFFRKLALSGIATLSACSIGLMSSSADVKLTWAELGQQLGQQLRCMPKRPCPILRKQEGDVDKRTYYKVHFY